MVAASLTKPWPKDQSNPEEQSDEGKHAQENGRKLNQGGDQALHKTVEALEYQIEIHGTPSHVLEKNQIHATHHGTHEDPQRHQTGQQHCDRRDPKEKPVTVLDLRP